MSIQYFNVKKRTKCYQLSIYLSTKTILINLNEVQKIGAAICKVIKCDVFLNNKKNRNLAICNCNFGMHHINIEIRYHLSPTLRQKHFKFNYYPDVFYLLKKLSILSCFQCISCQLST